MLAALLEAPPRRPSVLSRERVRRLMAAILGPAGNQYAAQSRFKTNRTYASQVPYVYGLKISASPMDSSSHFLARESQSPKSQHATGSWIC